jgi:F0F1-type ATP synthase membrane subunit c/vacuolar-type H+-ATPase subunit K
MMNRPSAGGGTDPGPEVRLRVVRMLWAIFLVTVFNFALIGWFARPEPDAAEAAALPPLLYGLAAAGLASVAASFPVKSAFYRRAAERREPAQIQTGFIIAIVLCEVAALLGLLGLFTTRSDYAFALFALAALGEALHFPRREDVLAAYYKPVG